MPVKPFLLLLALFWTLPGGPVLADQLAARDGWVVIPTTKTHGDLIDAVISATRANKMGVVTQAGPTQSAANRGITIPGNRVIGVFNNDFAVKILNLSPAAMIEAPVRLYVTENPDGTATLSYKTPSFVFAPYTDEGGDALMALAAQLDDRFAAIAHAAVN
ncbi:DUF302 domain-containing protein [Arenibacterium sp. CAU 1754]